MTYDIGNPPTIRFVSFLVNGEPSRYESVLAHVRAGFPTDRLVLGTFYGRTSPGFRGDGQHGKLIHLEGFENAGMMY